MAQEISVDIVRDSNGEIRFYDKSVLCTLDSLVNHLGTGKIILDGIKKEKK